MSGADQRSSDVELVENPVMRPPSTAARAVDGFSTAGSDAAEDEENDDRIWDEVRCWCCWCCCSCLWGRLSYKPRDEKEPHKRVGSPEIRLFTSVCTA